MFAAIPFQIQILILAERQSPQGEQDARRQQDVQKFRHNLGLPFAAPDALVQKSPQYVHNRGENFTIVIGVNFGETVSFQQNEPRKLPEKGRVHKIVVNIE